MKVYELAQKTNRTTKDLCWEFGVKSHLSNIPDEDCEKYLAGELDQGLRSDDVEEVIEEVVKIVVNEKEVVLDSDKIGSIRGLGAKSPYWFERESFGL